MDPQQILASINISIHVYTTFVYKEIFLAKKDNTSNVLAALRIANEQRNLSLLNIIALGEKSGNELNEIIQHLKSKGVKYLDEFIKTYVPNTKDSINSLGQLAEFSSILKDEKEFINITERFDRLAYILLNFLSIRVGNKQYGITECEVYYFDPNTHPDCYSHQSKEQLFPGKWYFNGFGLDITFGNYENKIYAGILIRGVKTFDPNKPYISGPSNVLKEIFSNTGNILNAEGGIRLDELMPNLVEEQKPIQTTRIGLTKKIEDIENFFDKPYRYLTNIVLAHKFVNKEKTIKHLLIQNSITKEDAKNIMGYNVKL